MLEGVDVPDKVLAGDEVPEKLEVHVSDVVVVLVGVSVELRVPEPLEVAVMLDVCVTVALTD